MTKIHSHTLPIGADIVDAFCLMQKGFTDQFVYYGKQAQEKEAPHCPYCLEEVAEGATRCPHCTAELPEPAGFTAKA